MWKRCCSFGLAVLLGGAINSYAQDGSNGVTLLPNVVNNTGKAILVQAPGQFPGAVSQAPAAPAAPAKDAPKVDKPAAPVEMPAQVATVVCDDSYGPTPLSNVGIFQKVLGCDSPIKISGWMDFDYTYSFERRWQE